MGDANIASLNRGTGLAAAKERSEHGVSVNVYLSGRPRLNVYFASIIYVSSFV